MAKSPRGGERETAAFLLRFKTKLAAGCALLMAGAVQAQVPPQPQQPVAPTREEVERPAPDRAEQAAPRLTVEGGIPRAPCALDNPEFRDIRFTLNDVVFEDLRGLPPEALQPAFAPYVGQNVPVSTICEIRDRASAILRDNGYIAAVEVPEQRIGDGTVRLRVLMAKLVGLRVRGDAGRAERLIAGYLEQLTDQEVFNAFEAERYLLLAGDLPGYNVRLALRSAERAPGEVIGEVTVVRTPVLVDLNVQNYGSREIGRWGGLLRGQFFGLTGLGDRTSLALFTTADFNEQQTIQLAHDFRIGSEGLAIGGQITYAWAQPDLNLANNPFESRTLFATLEASYPFIRRQAQTLRGAVGFDYVDQDVDFGDDPFNRDRLRVLFGRLTYDAVGLTPGDTRYSPLEPLWRLNAVAEIRQGLDIFDSSGRCLTAVPLCLLNGIVPQTRAEADSSATVLRGSVYGEYRPMPALTAALGVRAQYSGDPLLSFEEFSIGNYTIGRGYDPGTILGDSGIGFQAELRYGHPFPRSVDGTSAEGFIFYDQAWTWNEDRLAPLPRQELSSVGAGLRTYFGNRYRLEALVAFPLDRTGIPAQRHPRFLLSFTTRLWPWSVR